MTAGAYDLARFPLHLGLGARATVLDEFDGTPDWYARYAATHLEDGAEGRLVALHRFSSSWDTWEVHPHGDEVVICIEGEMTLYQDIEGVVGKISLRSGEAAINPPGAWHTADIDGPAAAVFITAGMGTQNRPR
jgi:mannose-6-phosphate isomerase-like protein (cupin superfamily)